MGNNMVEIIFRAIWWMINFGDIILQNNMARVEQELGL